jgi:hypothetical protein
MKMCIRKKCNKEKMMFLVVETKRRSQVHYTINYVIEVKERG